MVTKVERVKSLAIHLDGAPDGGVCPGGSRVPTIVQCARWRPNGMRRFFHQASEPTARRTIQALPLHPAAPRRRTTARTGLPAIMRVSKSRLTIEAWVSTSGSPNGMGWSWYALSQRLPPESKTQRVRHYKNTSYNLTTPAVRRSRDLCLWCESGSANRLRRRDWNDGPSWSPDDPPPFFESQR